jgi:sulfatase maturation enzyme AslB (radical SAM superfamily)
MSIPFQQPTESDHFSLEITTTALCNLGCTYCFEGVKTDKRRLDDKKDILIKRIEEILVSDWFKKRNYKKLTLSFWGGEPTLNPQLIIDIYNHFKDRDEVGWHIYTNAYNRKRLDMIVDVVDLSKFDIQISYDGADIGDKFRITHSGKGSSATVLENMEYFINKGATISLKATMPLKAMGDIHKTWKDYKKLHEKFKGLGNARITYSPTIDYVSDLPDQILPDTIEVFRKEMLKVAREEIEFYKENGHFLCGWFGAGDTKTHCSSGAHMHAINVDGESYACHGSFYSPNKEEMHGGNIEDDNWVNIMTEMTEQYKQPLGRVSDTCKNCVATTCMICPVSSLDLSKKETFIERWQDRWVNNMCGFYKAFGEIDRSVQQYLEKEIVLKTIPIDEAVEVAV